MCALRCALAPVLCYTIPCISLLFIAPQHSVYICACVYGYPVYTHVCTSRKKVKLGLFTSLLERCAILPATRNHFLSMCYPHSFSGTTAFCWWGICHLEAEESYQCIPLLLRNSYFEKLNFVCILHIGSILKKMYCLITQHCLCDDKRDQNPGQNKDLKHLYKKMTF